MYKKLFIDKDLESLFNKEIENLFLENDIIYQFVDNVFKDENVLFLTSNKNNLTKNAKNVLLIESDYDFLDIENTLFIKNFEDIIRIYKSNIVVEWASELQFLTQGALAYSKDKFDRERFERIRDISCDMLSYKYNVSKDDIRKIFANEVGYQTPKIENRAVVIRDNKILLVKEGTDEKWALPGGYQDVDRSIKENVIKECFEEAGAVVNPIRVIALQDYNRHHMADFPLGMLKIFVLCDYISQDFKNNIETLDAKFYSYDNLPELSMNRTTKEQIKMCFDCYYNQDTWKVIFD